MVRTEARVVRTGLRVSASRNQIIEKSFRLARHALPRNEQKQPPGSGRPV
jgi:hypothetical protein